MSALMRGLVLSASFVTLTLVAAAGHSQFWELKDLQRPPEPERSQP